MIYEKKVKVTNHGMISIPAALRAKYNIHEGDYVSFIEDENGMRIIPIENIEDYRKKSISTKKMLDIMRKSRKEDLQADQ